MQPNCDPTSRSARNDSYNFTPSGLDAAALTGCADSWEDCPWVKARQLLHFFCRLKLRRFRDNWGRIFLLPPLVLGFSPYSSSCKGAECFCATLEQHKGTTHLRFTFLVGRFKKKGRVLNTTSYRKRSAYYWQLWHCSV